MAHTSEDPIAIVLLGQHMCMVTSQEHMCGQPSLRIECLLLAAGQGSQPAASSLTSGQSPSQCCLPAAVVWCEGSGCPPEVRIKGKISSL